jgi:hypothetical protein
MVDSLLLNNLVHRLDLVSHLLDNTLLFNDGLDRLVVVVVHSLAFNCVFLDLGLLCLLLLGRVLESSLLGGDLGLDLVTLLILVDFALLGCDDLAVVLLGLDLAVLEGLDGGVVVVLVAFTVDDCLFARLVFALYRLMLDCWGDFLLDGSVFFACGGRGSVRNNFRCFDLLVFFFVLGLCGCAGAIGGVFLT